MKPSLSEDLTSIAAIAVGATITIGLSAALLLRESDGRTARPVAVPVMRIPDGYRAVTVPVSDAVAVAGWAVSGTRVDVMVTLNDHRGQQAPVTQVVLQNVPVLGSDRSISQNENGQTVQINFATLLVTPAEADSLAMAETTGALRLVRRPARQTIEVIRGTSRSRTAQGRSTP